VNDRTLTPVQRFERFVAEAAGAGRAEVLAWERLPGGAIQENTGVEAQLFGGALAGRHRWVVRTDARSAVAASRTRAEEFALLHAAHAAGTRAPRPLWLCDDGRGPAFFVMERVPGVATGHRLAKDDALVPDRARLARELGENLARIHAISAGTPSLAFLGEPPPEPAMERIAAYRRDLDLLREHGAGAWPVLEWALAWGERHAPSPARATLVHRDYRTGNYLVDGGRLAAILDWEFAGWGDPLEDLGWFLAGCWRFGRPDREAGGIGRADDFLAGYAAVSGRAVDPAETHFWQVIAHVRWAVIALDQAERHASGREPSLELALTAHIVPELEWAILSLTGES
jgi:aminoglycoside phosphotransferase (APT) family kinase protein